MQTDREVRYQSATDLRRDLDTILTLPRAALIAQQQAAAEATARATQAQKQHEAAKGGHAKAPPAKKTSSLGPILGLAASVALVAGLYVMLTDDGSKTSTPKDNAASPSTPAAPKRPENILVPSPTPPAPAVASVKPAPKPEMPVTQPSPPPSDLKSAAVHTFGGHRYLLVEEHLNWKDAKAHAEREGGHLATVTTKEEHEWLLQTFGMKLRAAGGFAYLGATLDRSTGTWRWITGEPFEFTAWGTPPNGTETLLALTRGGWDDLTNPNRKGSCIIEWDDGGTPPVSAAVASTAPTMPAVVPATPSPAPPVAPPPADPLPPGWTDLLAKADPAQGAVTGQWQKGPDGLVVKAQPGVLPFDLNQVPSEQYDFEMDFTVHSGEPDVAHILTLPGGHWFIARLTLNNCHFGPMLDGQQPIDRKEAYAPDAKLAQGRRYRSLVQVRKDSVRLVLDEKETLVFNGDLKRLTPDGQFALRNTANLGIASHQSDVTFHRIGFRPHDPSRMDKKDKDALIASDSRLAQFEAGFQTRYQADAEKPFLAAIARLNQSYVANGIARARSAAQAKGSLLEVTMFDAEKALIEKGGVVPAEDAAETPASLKSLRDTYRGALDKITAERDAKAAPLYDLYLKAIDGYVAELTKAGNTNTAVRIQALRDEIAAQKPVTAVAAANAPAASTSKTTLAPAPRPPAGGGSSWRTAAEYLVNNGGFFTALKNGVNIPVAKQAEIPSGRFDIIELNFERLGSVLPPAKSADFAALNGLRDLQRAHFRPMHNGLSDSAFAFLANNSELANLNIEAAYALTDEVLAHIAGLKKLDYLAIQYAESFTGRGLDKIGGAGSITNLETLGCGITDEGLRAISTFKKLQALRTSSPKITPAGFAALTSLKTLATLTLSGTSLDDEGASAIAGIPNLSFLDVQGTKLTDVGLAKLRSLKKLTTLNITGTAVTLEAAAEFQKQMPQCRVSR
ncbi:lectin-like protein, partial [Prosthecobacter sp.]|uniref:lectin-like protein n=1 Tax=Prosthecobacter sp. TaxID=1965333 RepID=UPI001D263EBF